MAKSRPNRNKSETGYAIKRLAEARKILTPALHQYCRRFRTEVQSLLDHAFISPGNCERGLLTSLAWELKKPKTKNILPAQVALELLHFSTLVVDDVFDESELRGGFPSVSKAFGVSGAIVAGEILSAMATRALSDHHLVQLTSPSKVVEAIDLLAATKEKIYCGQRLDLLFERRKQVTRKEYFEMIDLTTGCLIEAAVLTGAILRGASKSEKTALSRYGRCLGMALQIRNDVSELIGMPERIGKKLGGDLEQGKKRLPLIHALEVAPRAQKYELRRIIEKERLSERQLALVVEIFHSLGSIKYCQDTLRELTEEAIGSILKLPETKARSAMIGLAKIVANAS